MLNLLGPELCAPSHQKNGKRKYKQAVELDPCIDTETLLTCSSGSGKTLSLSGTNAGCSTISGNPAAVAVSPDDEVVVAMGTVVRAFLETAAALSVVLSTGTHSP